MIQEAKKDTQRDTQRQHRVDGLSINSLVKARFSMRVFASGRVYLHGKGRVLPTVLPTLRAVFHVSGPSTHATPPPRMHRRLCGILRGAGRSGSLNGRGVCRIATIAPVVVSTAFATFASVNAQPEAWNATGAILRGRHGKPPPHPRQARSRHREFLGAVAG